MRSSLFLILATLSAGALSQRPPVFRAGTEQVVVPVTVKDAKGQLVEGLEAGDFRLLEDSVEQKIVSFSADPLPLAAAVLIDAGLSNPTAHRLRATFPGLSEAFSELDEVAVFSFDTGFRTVAPFTSDKERIYTALKHMDIGAEYSQTGEPLNSPTPRINGWPVGGPPASHGSTSQVFKNIDDAVFAAAKLLGTRDPARRRIILLISDGLNSPRNRVSTAEVLTVLRKSGVEVYSIGLDDAKLSKNANVLARYGPASGGDFYTALKKTAIDPIYARITEQARYQYILTYIPQKPPTVEPVFRAIEVRVKKPGVTVLARDGYIPEPRAPQP
jgi:VWFA-related protein